VSIRGLVPTKSLGLWMILVGVSVATVSCSTSGTTPTNWISPPVQASRNTTSAIPMAAPSPIASAAQLDFQRGRMHPADRVTGTSCTQVFTDSYIDNLTDVQFGATGPDGTVQYVLSSIVPSVESPTGSVVTTYFIDDLGVKNTIPASARYWVSPPAGDPNNFWQLVVTLTTKLELVRSVTIGFQFGQVGLPASFGTSWESTVTCPSPTPRPTATPIPTPSPSPSPQWEAAFQTSTGSLETYTSSGTVLNTGLGMMAGSSPSIAALAGGGYEVAFQANTGILWTLAAGFALDSQDAMMAGTSPAVAAAPGGGFEVAFQSSTGTLETYTPSGLVNTGLGMMAGTSPSIAPLAGGGYEVAFQANTGILWTLAAGFALDSGDAMMSGTSPAVGAAPGGGFEVAFQSNTGTLETYTTSNLVNTGLGMMAGTSPSIAPLAGGGYEVAFQANSGILWTLAAGFALDSQDAMMTGTSPAVSGVSGGSFEAAFQSNAGILETYTPSSLVNTGLAMKAGTSPAIAP